MTRIIHKSKRCQRDLENVIHDLDNLRKHNYEHFARSELVQMEQASVLLHQAYSAGSLRPPVVEEL